MLHLPFLKLTERVFGSHPYRIVSVSYGRFHGGNTGSNPVEDANLFNGLGGHCRIFIGTKRNRQNAILWARPCNRQDFQGYPTWSAGTKRHRKPEDVLAACCSRLAQEPNNITLRFAFL